MAKYITDLAMESGHLRDGAQSPGVKVARESDRGVERVRVNVLNDQGERETGKRPGTYTTLYSPDMCNGEPETFDALRDMLISEVRELAQLDDDLTKDIVLVLGLGNRTITPDAIGPRAADLVLSTRAIMQAAPQLEGMRQVMTSAPGVFGATGIEVSETIKGLVREVHPTLIIALDALCARDPMRIATTIQISDTGIQPGSGVGNHRSALDSDSLGVKVIAMGVPTVVYASSIIMDALERANIAAQDEGDALFSKETAQMIVAPREIDALVEHSSRLISEALNLALNPGLSAEDLKWLTI